MSVSTDGAAATVLLNLGQLHGRCGRIELCKQYTRRSIAADPNEPLAHCNLGSALSNGGSHAEALACAAPQLPPLQPVPPPHQLHPSFAPTAAAQPTPHRPHPSPLTLHPHPSPGGARVCDATQREEGGQASSPPAAAAARALPAARRLHRQPRGMGVRQLSLRAPREEPRTAQTGARRRPGPGVASIRLRCVQAAKETPRWCRPPRFSKERVAEPESAFGVSVASRCRSVAY